MTISREGLRQLSLCSLQAAIAGCLSRALQLLDPDQKALGESYKREMEN